MVMGKITEAAGLPDPLQPLVPQRIQREAFGGPLAVSFSKSSQRGSPAQPEPALPSPAPASDAAALDPDVLDPDVALDVEPPEVIPLVLVPPVDPAADVELLAAEVAEPPEALEEDCVSVADPDGEVAQPTGIQARSTLAKTNRKRRGVREGTRSMRGVAFCHGHAAHARRILRDFGQRGGDDDGDELEPRPNEPRPSTAQALSAQEQATSAGRRASSLDRSGPIRAPPGQEHGLHSCACGLLASKRWTCPRQRESSTNVSA